MSFSNNKFSWEIMNYLLEIVFIRAYRLFNPNIKESVVRFFE